MHHPIIRAAHDYLNEGRAVTYVPDPDGEITLAVTRICSQELHEQVLSPDNATRAAALASIAIEAHTRIYEGEQP